MAGITVSNWNLDKGWAWLTLIGALLCQIVTGGTVRSLGIINIDLLERWDAAPSSVAWINTVVSLTRCIVAPLVGYMFDRHSMRITCIVSTVAAAAGCIVASFYQSLAVMLTVFSIPNGICHGILTVSSWAALGVHFHKKRPFASSLASTGGSLGLLVVPVALGLILDHSGLTGAMTMFGGLILHGCIIGVIIPPSRIPTRGRDADDLNAESGDHVQNDTSCVQPRAKGSTTRKEDSPRQPYWHIFRNGKLVRSLLVELFCAMAVYNWYIYLPAFAQEVGLTKYEASLSLALVGFSEMVTLPILGAIVNRFRFNISRTLAVCCVFSVLLCVSSYWMRTCWVVMLYAVLYGAFGSFALAMKLPLILESVDGEVIGSATGLVTPSVGIGAAIGTPILGLVKEKFGSYLAVQLFISLMYVPAVLLLLWNIFDDFRSRRSQRTRTLTVIIEEETDTKDGEVG